MDKLPIWCINVSTATERWKRMNERAEDMKITLKRYNATTPDNLEGFVYCDKLKPVQKACSASHFKLWKHLFETNVEYALILEDDTVFRHDFRERIDELFEKINSKEFEGWQLFLLHSSDPVSPHNQWVLTENQCSTGAYIIHRRGIEYILRMDVLYSADWMTQIIQFQHHSYSFFPWLVIQDFIDSSISDVNVDREKMHRLLREANYSLDNYRLYSPIGELSLEAYDQSGDFDKAISTYKSLNNKKSYLLQKKYECYLNYDNKEIRNYIIDDLFSNNKLEDNKDPGLEFMLSLYYYGIFDVVSGRATLRKSIELSKEFPNIFLEREDIFQNMIMKSLVVKDEVSFKTLTELKPNYTINFRSGESGSSPLHVAVINNLIDSIHLLLDKKADVDLKDNNNDSPLNLVIEFGKFWYLPRFIELHDKNIKVIVSEDLVNCIGDKIGDLKIETK